VFLLSTFVFNLHRGFVSLGLNSLGFSGLALCFGLGPFLLFPFLQQINQKSICIISISTDSVNKIVIVGCRMGEDRLKLILVAGLDGLDCIQKWDGCDQLFLQFSFHIIILDDIRVAVNKHIH